jgi:hypothetical protein
MENKMFGKHICSIQIKTTGSTNPKTQLKVNGTLDKKCGCSGWGYDTIGTCLGAYLENYHKGRLEDLITPELRKTYLETPDLTTTVNFVRIKENSGVYFNKVKNTIIVDGGFGVDCMIELAEQMGLIIFRSKNSLNFKDTEFFEIFEKIKQ